MQFDIGGGVQIEVEGYDSLERLVGHLRGLLTERLARCDGAMLPASLVTDIDATLFTEIGIDDGDRVDVEEPVLLMKGVDLEGDAELCVQRSLVVGLTHELRDRGVQVFFVTAREEGEDGLADAEARRQLADICRFDTEDAAGDDEVLLYPESHPDKDEVAEDQFWCFKESARRVVAQMTDMVLAIGDRAWDATSLEVAKRMAVGLGHVDEDGAPALDALDNSPQHYLITHRARCGRTWYGVKLGDFEAESIVVKK